MVWPDWQIREWAERGGIDPFEPENVNPASIDLRFSGCGKLATPGGWVEMADKDGIIIIEPRQLWLLDTLEYVRMPGNAGGALMLKSSMGRMGLEHLHAGWFDPAFEGTATLEIVNMSPLPIGLTKGDRIVQLIIHQMSARPDRNYQVTGRYNGQNRPQEALPPR